MVAYTDVRIVKNTYKNDDYKYVVEVAYEEVVDGETVLDWKEASSISINNSFNTLEFAKKFQHDLLGKILLKSEVVVE